MSEYGGGGEGTDQAWVALLLFAIVAALIAGMLLQACVGG